MSERWRNDETLELIKFVQNRKSIYNRPMKDYLPKMYHEHFWRSTDIKFKKYPGASLKKWAILRARFSKEQEKANNDRFPSTWQYYDAMKFLAPYMRRNSFSKAVVPDEIVRNALSELDGVTRSTLQKSIVNDASDKNEDYLSDAEEDTANTETSKNEVVESNNETSSEDWVDDNLDDISNFQAKDTEEDIYDGPMETEYTINDFAECNETIEYIESPEKTHQNSKQTVDEVASELCSCKTDPDAMFLLSLLPDIQSLPKKEKGQFKLKIQKLLQDMLYSNDDC